jgi:hypothetical protein
VFSIPEYTCLNLAEKRRKIWKRKKMVLNFQCPKWEIKSTDNKQKVITLTKEGAVRQREL